MALIFKTSVLLHSNQYNLNKKRFIVHYYNDISLEFKNIHIIYSDEVVTNQSKYDKIIALVQAKINLTDKIDSVLLYEADQIQSEYKSSFDVQQPRRADLYSSLDIAQKADFDDFIAYAKTKMI